MLPLRPMLNPALRRVWRDPGTVQFGLDPARAVVIGGLDAPRARLVEALDGTRDRAGVHAVAAQLGVPRPDAVALLDLLAGAGVLIDGAADTGALAALDLVERDRVAPDLASLSLLHPDGGPAALARRRAAAVGVRGAGRVGAIVATLLAAAGTGRVVPDDSDRVRAGDLGIAGPPIASVGRRRDASLRASIAAQFPQTRTATLRGRRALDAVVVAGPARLQHGHGDDLVRDGVPHLYVDVRETTGILGPFVLPGRTACLQCQVLQRTDRDPGWLHLQAMAPGPPPPCDTVLATLVAAQACLHLLTFLDSGGELLPPSADGTLETALPHGPTRRRTWRPHPACGCQSESEVGA